MNLSNAFLKARNLGDVTAAWLKYMQTEINDRNIQSNVRLTAGDCASLMAPASLIAKALLGLGLETAGKTTRVLILGSDPITRMDRAMWAPFAGDFLGNGAVIEVFQTQDESPYSTLYPLGEQIGLRPSTVVSHTDFQAGTAPAIDAVVWIHPATETREDPDSFQTAKCLARSGVPVIACAYNELDLHIQNYMICNHGWQLELLGGRLARGTVAVNNFGISSKDLGVDGGWGALLCRLAPTTKTIQPLEVSTVKAAVGLVRIEAASLNPWTFGSRINGVAFNRIIPVGLLGNMAVDQVTGFVLSEVDQPRVLQVVAQLWDALRACMPGTSFELVLWAARVRLAFNTGLPKEPKKRDEVIELLTEAYEAGVLDAGIALARGYESRVSGTTRPKAVAIYQDIAARHPLSAYALGHEAIARGDNSEALNFFKAAAEFGYPPAITDYGILLLQMGQPGKGLALIQKASGLHDPQANFLTAEAQIEAGDYMNAVQTLRRAWATGHAKALEVADWLVTQMMERNLGKRVILKQERRDIDGFMKKRARLEDQVQKALQADA